MRVGTVLTASRHPTARNPAYVLTIDFGPLGIKQSSAQITAAYKPEDLPGRQIVAVVNLAPRRVVSIVSEVLVLAAVGADINAVLLSPVATVPNGVRIL